MMHKIVNGCNQDQYAIWDERAKKFGELGDGYTNKEYQEYEYWLRLKKVFNVISKMFGDVSGLCILDAGCGTGRWCVEFAKKGANVLGVDVSEELLKLAKKRVEEEKLINKVLFEKKRIEDLEYSKQFDIVISIMVLQHIIDNNSLKKAIKSLAEACKSNGIVIIVESTEPNEEKIVYKILKKIKNTNKDLTYLKIRPKEYWIRLLEKEGLELILTEGIAFFGRYFYQLFIYKNSPKIIKKIVRELCMFLDLTIAGLKPFDTVSQPTLFVFRKR